MKQGRIKFLVLLLLLGLLALGGLQAERYFRVEQHRRAAEQAAARFDFDEAERHLRICLEARPRSAALYLQLARNARRAEHYDQANDYIRQCQQLEGKNPDNALESVLLQAQVGDTAGVGKILQEQVDLGSPETGLILEAMARGYAHTYRLDEAMHCLSLLLKREPDNVIALRTRALLWKTAGNHVAAEEDLARAVDAYPQHRAARQELGDLLLFTKQPQKALPQFEYLRQQPGGDAPEVLLGLARALHRLGRTDEARPLLDELLARDPQLNAALVERGTIALQTESPAAAEKWLRQAVEERSCDSQAIYLLAQALRRQGREEEARSYDATQERLDADMKALEATFRRVNKSPHDPQPRLEAARICLRNGRDDEAERWLLSALELEPRHAETRAALADLYERTGRAELAADYRR